MQELHKGDLIISNDLMGFIVELQQDKILLNTTTGKKLIAKHNNIAVMSTGQELAMRYSQQLLKGVNKR